jgi:hypothetical protein
MRKDVQAASDRMIGLTLEEKVMTKRAMTKEFMGSGHWYKCMNGNILWCNIKNLCDLFL